MVAGSLSESEFRLGCAIFDPLGNLDAKGMKDANRTLTLVRSYPTTSDGVVGRVLFVLPRIVVHLFPSLSETSITGVSEILNLLSKIRRIGQNNVSDDVRSCDHACHMVEIFAPQSLFVADEDGILHASSEHTSDDGRTRLDRYNLNQITGKNLVKLVEGETVARSVNRREGTVRLNQNAGHFVSLSEDSISGWFLEVKVIQPSQTGIPAVFE